MVVVGAAFGGLEVVRGLRNVPAHLTVIDRQNYHLFQPLLYQVATAVLSPADIIAPIRGVPRHRRDVAVLLAEATGVDVDKHQVLVHEHSGSHTCSVPYDYLVVATGARHGYFGHEDWARSARGLTAIGDATAIRRQILLAFEAAEIELDPAKQREMLTFVVVGGGPTGVELAGAIAELARRALVADFRRIDPASARVLLVEAMPRLLLAFPEVLARRAQAALRRLGVEVRTGAGVERVDAEGVVVGGERLPARTVIWAAGVKPSPAGLWLAAPVDRAGRVVVEEDLTVPGHPEVFAIGDTASASFAGKPLPGTAAVAVQEGRFVAAEIRRRLAGAASGHRFRYHDRGNLATVGRGYAIADLGRLRLSGFAGWLTWLGVHILKLIGFRNRVLVLVQWAWTYLTLRRGARLIVYDDEPGRAERAA
jgi:NADH dehydrogenase